MKVVTAQFIVSAIKPSQFPPDSRPEIAFVGRSNVGKSTLLNRLLNRKRLAKTSATPGKTQTINFFDVNGRIYFVDLPGYGFAKVPKGVKQRWGKALTAYLRDRASLRLVVHLMDARHKPTVLDADMLELLDEAEVPTLVVATKADKLKQSERKRNLARIRATLELDEDALILPVSGVTAENIPELWRVIDDVVEAC